MGSNGKDSDRLAQWFTYLEEECRSPEGLLCFYDSPKSIKVSYLCEVLAGCFADPPKVENNSSFIFQDPLTSRAIFLRRG